MTFLDRTLVIDSVRRGLAIATISGAALIVGGCGGSDTVETGAPAPSEAPTTAASVAAVPPTSDASGASGGDGTASGGDGTASGGDGTASGGEQGDADFSELGPIEMADAVVAALTSRDYDLLARIASREGVTVSLDAYVDFAEDATISPEQLAQAADDETVIRWGASYEDGVYFDDTIAGQFASVLTRSAMTDTEKISVDERLDGHHGTIDNLQTMFPGATVVEYWNGGQDPQFDGFDWTSVRIVLVDGRWRALVLDEWAP